SRVFSGHARQCSGRSGPLENVRRLVASGGVEAGGMGSGACLARRAAPRRTTERRSSARPRGVSRLLRREIGSLVCAMYIRLMYTELHARSAFSFLEGASVPEELVSACADHGMNAMALLDRDGVYGSARFHLAAKKMRLGAHIGAEVTAEGGWRYPL